ncbi:SGNH/GDSL hydrolase family protein [Polynucleobacter sp. AP-Titi-500A-B4]|uniref:SGNH/GDSL hydrolase family protein n=1 Tax=Polynucleobacter sp. AP-Titi-500A-B4 TaxID=2576923 RepID=UPI001BFDD94C|nr:SGNH/GDSL hydrolase family protein [Polynucleobacter sp. AP-Titi-500A-B4]QWE12819.1 SGNH/GDSL hydrolase family protein [Polynucleobacter sp. AP-Titi-500A-B4]
MALGGSTKYGFYQQFSRGNGWPYCLNGLLERSGKKLQVINGGVGGYGSSQELLKLLMDAPRLNVDIKYVISLNGINDTKGYGGLPVWLEGKIPFWTWLHYTMYSSERYVKQNVDSKATYFPSFMSLIWYISEKTLTPNFYKVQNLFYLEGQKEISAGQQWYGNIRIMHEVSKELGAQYYVFLQPIMQLNGQIPHDILSSDYLLYGQMSPEYLLEINRRYQDLRKFCSKVNFCVDITAIAPPAGNFYADPRHYNEAGNKLIANKIYDYIYPLK